MELQALLQRVQYQLTGSLDFLVVMEVIWEGVKMAFL